MNKIDFGGFAMKHYLRPCPFCNSQEIIVVEGNRTIDSKKQRCAIVICSKCHAQGSVIPFAVYGKTSHCSEAKIESIRIWNNRNYYQDGEEA